MNGGSTSNRTPPQRQLPRMLLLIHESTLNPQLLNNSARRFACSNAINALRVRQEIRRRRAPIEEFQDKENCARRLMFDQRWIDFQDVRFVQTAKFAGQLLTRRCA